MRLKLLGAGDTGGAERLTAGVEGSVSMGGGLKGR